MIDNKTLQETIASEYEKSQKHIKEMWLGEGWYKTTPNSFDYFTSGFEAGLNYRYLTQEEIEAIEGSIYFLDWATTYGNNAKFSSTLRNLLERTKENL